MFIVKACLFGGIPMHELNIAKYRIILGPPTADGLLKICSVSII